MGLCEADSGYYLAFPIEPPYFVHLQLGTARPSFPSKLGANVEANGAIKRHPRLKRFMGHASFVMSQTHQTISGNETPVPAY